MGVMNKQQVVDWYMDTKFNMLTIIGNEPSVKMPSGQTKKKVLCLCECGMEKSLLFQNVKRGNVKSCGCLRRKIKHGMINTRQYRIRQNMKDRCKNKNRKEYKDYGGRWILYDIKRDCFEGFREDMAEGYSDYLTLDRIDNDVSYSKNNCRRVTMKEQNKNKRNNIMHKGKCLKEWCSQLGVKYTTIYSRIFRSGRSIEKALHTILMPNDGSRRKGRSL